MELCYRKTISGGVVLCLELNQMIVEKRSVLPRQLVTLEYPNTQPVAFSHFTTWESPHKESHRYAERERGEF